MAISAVYSSVLKRAVETAQNIAGKCSDPEVMTNPDLRERHLGDLQGFDLYEAAELKPDAYLATLSSRTDQEIPGGGESFDQLFHCCTSSLQKIGEKHRVIVQENVRSWSLTAESREHFTSFLLQRQNCPDNTECICEYVVISR